MPVLRYAYVLALTVWLGGMIAIGGVAAPSAFAMLESLRGEAGRGEAAAVVGEMLRRLHLVGWVAGAVLVSTLVTMRVIGPRPPGFGVRVGIVSAMLAFSLAASAGVDPQIAALRAEIGVPVGTLSADDGRRIAFGRLHGLSTLLMALTVCGGLVLAYWETRE